MIRLGLRLTVNGGREAITRLVLLVAAVGLGVGLLLVAVAGVNAVSSQNDKYAWLSTGEQSARTGASTSASAASADPLWFDIQGSVFEGQTIGVVNVAATGPSSPVPPGISHLPGPGQYYASPALTVLLKSTPAAELGDRFAGHQVGTISDAALPAPNSLLVVIGNTAAQMAHMPGAVQVRSLATTPPNSCNGQCLPGEGLNADGMDLILSVVALAILFPVLIFTGTATRLSAARREQRFAAMRLTGAAPRQISVIAAVESTVAAVLGVAAGFGIFFGLRLPLASIPFTGAPFFPADLSLSLADIAAVAIGVPVAAAVAARLALRRVVISPLGVARKVTPKPPRAWRIVPLLAGLAELGWFAEFGRPPTTPGQIQAFLPGFLLILVGLVIAGPWLTMAGARLLARRTSKPGALIAARRLADDPRAGFRAVSGLVLALFVTTVAAVLITTQDAKSSSHQPVTGALASDTLFAQFAGGPQAPASAVGAGVLAQLRAIRGVSGVVVVRTAPASVTVPASVLLAQPAGAGPGPGPRAGRGPGFFGPAPDVPAGLASCAELADVPAFGRCPAGAQVAAVTPWDWFGSGNLPGVTWPAATMPVQSLDTRGADMLLAATDGSAQAVEQVRTVLWNAYPAQPAPLTFAEQNAQGAGLDQQYQQLADVVVLVSVVIAGCTLAASVAAGLADRKRPFSMLRLAGAPFGVLRRAITIESAVPLLLTAAIAIGAGFAAAAMFATAQLHQPMTGPEAAYYAFTGLGILLSLGIIAATMPLLRRITGPEVARNE